MALMGRRPVKPKRAEHELEPWIKVYFLTGETPPDGTPEFSEYFKLEYLDREGTLAKKWLQHRDALVAEWIETRPGTRPWHWWQSEYEDDFVDYLPLEDESQESYRARLDAHDRESEAATLRRRGLLLPGELGRIPREDFEPVEPEAA